MPEQTVEILIRARDEATRTLTQATNQVVAANRAAEQSQQGLVRSLGQAERGAVSFSRQVSGAAASARFLGFTVINELSPALGTGASRIASLASVVTLGSSAMTALAVVAGGALVVALTEYFQAARKAREEQEKFNETIRQGAIEGLVAEAAKLEPRIEAARAKLARFTDEGVEGTFDHAQAQKELNDLLERQERINQAAFVTGSRLLDIRSAIADVAKRDRDAAIQLEATAEAYDELAGFIKRAREETVAMDAAVHSLVLELLELESSADLKAFAQAVAQSQQTIADVEAKALEARDARTQEAGETIDKIIREARDREGDFERAMTSVGNAGADALFDALIGRSRSLGEAFKSFFEGLARDIFRNTLTTLVGGKTHGLSLQNLLSLGGGGRPLGSVAAVAAGVPNTAGVDVATRTATGGFGDRLVFGPSPEEIAEMARTGVPLPEGLTFGQLGAGLAGIGIGALGLLGASQAQDPLTGALSGGLGGLGAGLGLGTLFPALGAALPLGPLGLVAGLGFGIFSGLRGRRRRKREEARLRRAQAQVELIESADTLEELEALSVTGLEPEAQAALRQRATPLVLGAGRAEIAGTRSLSGIRDILARGVSPDVGGGELRLEALRREQEILGELEEIGGISIDEQLEGGIRRRTIVGAGAFGLARARQAGGPVVVDEAMARRLGRILLQDRQFLEQFLREALGHASAIGLTFADLEALR